MQTEIYANRKRLQLFYQIEQCYIIHFLVSGKCAQEVIRKTSSLGVIKNYGFPYGYRKNQLCIYSVILPQGYRLKINITNLELGINYVEYFFTGLKI